MLLLLIEVLVDDFPTKLEDKELWDEDKSTLELHVLAELHPQQK